MSSGRIKPETAFRHLTNIRRAAAEELMPRVQRQLKSGKWGKPSPTKRQYVGPGQLESDEQLLERLHNLNPGDKFRIGADKASEIGAELMDSIEGKSVPWSRYSAMREERDEDLYKLNAYRKGHADLNTAPRHLRKIHWTVETDPFRYVEVPRPLTRPGPHNIYHNQFKVGADMANVVTKQYSTNVRIWRDGCMLRAAVNIQAGGQRPVQKFFEVDLRPIARWVADMHKGLHDGTVPCFGCDEVHPAEVSLGALQDFSAAARAAAVKRAAAQAQARRALAMRTASIRASSAAAQNAARAAANRAALAAHRNITQLHALPPALQTASSAAAATAAQAAQAAAPQLDAQEEECEEECDEAEELEAENDEGVDEIRASVTAGQFQGYVSRQEIIGARRYRTVTRVGPYKRRRPLVRSWRSPVNVHGYTQDRFSPRFEGFPGSVFHAVSKLGKSAIGRAIAKTVHSVVRSKIVGAAVGVTAVVFPPVGLPAAAAYATANVALDKIEQADRVRKAAQELIANGKKGQVKAVAGDVAKVLAEDAKVKQSLKSIAAKARAGDPEAIAATKIFAITHASRQKMRRLAPQHAGRVPGVLVSESGGRVLKGSFVRVA